MSQATIVLEDMIKAVYLRNDWWYWSSPTAAVKISTLSALALRICTLDAAILYEKTVPVEEDPSEICKAGGESPTSSLANVTRSSPRLHKALNSDPVDCSKLKSRSSKRRRDLGVWSLVDMFHCEKYVWWNRWLQHVEYDEAPLCSLLDLTCLWLSHPNGTWHSVKARWNMIWSYSCLTSVVLKERALQPINCCDCFSAYGASLIY